MKALVTYQPTFQVTREVDIDEDDFSAWVEREYATGKQYTATPEALVRYLNQVDTEFHAEVFRDWRTDQPLPRDFELQWADVSEVEPISPDSGMAVTEEKP